VEWQTLRPALFQQSTFGAQRRARYQDDVIAILPYQVETIVEGVLLSAADYHASDNVRDTHEVTFRNFVFVNYLETVSAGWQVEN
jgi:hypothetical protein